MNNLQIEGVGGRIYHRSLSDGGEVFGRNINASKNIHGQRQFIAPSGHKGYHGVPPWITNTKQTATSPGMFQQRLPAPALVKPVSPSGYQADTFQLGARPLQGQTSRRSRHFVPTCRKDEYYWMKRRKNNEAARKSREKRRNNDMILAQNVLVLLQENIKLKKDLFAVKMKYNEIEPEEFKEFKRKLEDGDLLPGLTQNLNLADYGIPEHVVKALNCGADVNLSKYVTMPCERKMSNGHSANESGIEEMKGSSSDDYVMVGLSSAEEHRQTMTPANQDREQQWLDEQHTKMDTSSTADCTRATTIVTNTWAANPGAYTPDGPATEEVRNDGGQRPRFYSHDLVRGAEMLQTFVHYSWQQAGAGSVFDPVRQRFAQRDGANSSSSDDAPSSVRPGMTGTGPSQEEPDRDTDSAMARENSSSPQSDESGGTWRNWQGFASSSSSGQDDWSSKSGDSSSDSSSGSHVASPRQDHKREDSTDACDSDDKSCRLPYKLRFKLATLHGEQAIQQH